jgi:tRNA U38,U39,U40 pseudouridine synthase TruA
MISVDIVGRSFLYHMVRNIVGSLRLVGSGRETPEGIQARLDRRSRNACCVPAPAHGLTLTQIGYWGEDGGMSFEEWAASRPPDDVRGQRLVIGPPRPPPAPACGQA